MARRLCLCAGDHRDGGPGPARFSRAGPCSIASDRAESAGTRIQGSSRVQARWDAADTPARLAILNRIGRRRPRDDAAVPLLVKAPPGSRAESQVAGRRHAALERPGEVGGPRLDRGAEGSRSRPAQRGRLGSGQVGPEAQPAIPDLVAMLRADKGQSGPRGLLRTPVHRRAGGPGPPGIRERSGPRPAKGSRGGNRSHRTGGESGDAGLAGAARRPGARGPQCGREGPGGDRPRGDRSADPGLATPRPAHPGDGGPRTGRHARQGQPGHPRADRRARDRGTNRRPGASAPAYRRATTPATSRRRRASTRSSRTWARPRSRR